MFEKPATEMAVGSIAVITSLGILKGAVIRRTKDNLWEQIGGRVRSPTDEYYAWNHRNLPEFMVVAVREPRLFPSVVRSDGVPR